MGTLRRYSKPKIVVSRCIGFDAVRYDGHMINNDIVEALKPYVTFIPICPEVEIGLPIPRETLRLVSILGEKRMIQPATNFDYTENMKEWANKFLDSLPPVDGFIMKSRSPSSGLYDTKTYAKIEKSQSLGRGSGLFGAEVINRYSDLALEDEKRLLNPRIKDHFLKKIYTLASFRELMESNSVQGLIEFQSINKLLLTAYSQKELHILGRLVANIKAMPTDQLFSEYLKHLKEALKHPPRPGSNINIAAKSFGYFSDKLEQSEKKLFMDLIESYKRGVVPFSAPAAILKSWFIRFDEKYLLSQTFYWPYPEELIDIGISSTGYEERDLWKKGEEPEFE
jgi:uncharacterized protein YbgA (DUF1722 family)/uncharacterized protein YbbK (DUF523 family)